MTSPQIATLPIASRSIIRSTTIVTSLPQLISELVQNSLDAGASHVDVGVDVEQWQCWVRDDGSGMDRSGMSILAKEGEDGRYGTSKAYNPASLENISTFGFRGEALASAADVSCLEISSRTSTSRDTWSVILKGGKKLYYGSAVRWRRERPGTTVCIRDAFYNLPIRRLSHPNPTRTLELVRKDLESMALVFPGVAFSLENSSKEKAEGNGKGRILTIPKTPSSLSAFRHLFGRALCEHVDEIDECMGEMRIQGFLSLEGAHSKSHQYLYVNRHLLSPCDLHRAIDTQFSSSSFGKHAFDEAGRTGTLLPRSRRSPRKTERRPVYLLNISVPSRSVDNCLDPAKAAVQFQNPEAVADFVSSVTRSFLFRHGFEFSNAKAAVKSLSSSPSPRKRRKIMVGGGMNSRSRPHTPTASGSQGPVQQRTDNLAPSADPTIDDAQELQWVDPTTGRVYKIDAKTGNSYPLNAARDEHGDADEGRTKRVETRRLCKNLDSCHAGDAVPDWIEQVLDGWKNPTFGLQEPGVPVLTSMSSFSRQPWLQPQFDPGRQPSKFSRFFDANLTAGRRNNAVDASTSFDKAQLKRAEVIGQVDKKFVACLVTDDNTGVKTLILVDQHAADERIRVERFLSVLCRGFLEHDTLQGIETRDIQPAAPVLLTRPEARALYASESYREAFERWGFRFANMTIPRGADQDESGEDYIQVLVETIPEVVSEKLLMGDDLRELVKGFLARLEGEGDVPIAVPDDSSPSSSGTGWIAALRWCPRELLDLVNSKACRGAIMFNDTLSIEQCERLVSQLSDTVWPFMCAHGRPSLVPLTNVEHKGGRTTDIDWRNWEHIHE